MCILRRKLPHPAPICLVFIPFDLGSLRKCPWACKRPVLPFRPSLALLVPGRCRSREAGEAANPKFVDPGAVSIAPQPPGSTTARRASASRVFRAPSAPAPHGARQRPCWAAEEAGEHRGMREEETDAKKGNERNFRVSHRHDCLLFRETPPALSSPQKQNTDPEVEPRDRQNPPASTKGRKKGRRRRRSG